MMIKIHVLFPLPCVYVPIKVVVHRVEDLPAMDYLGFQKRGVDAKVRVEFGNDSKEATTEVIFFMSDKVVCSDLGKRKR